MSDTYPGSAALDQFLETLIRRGVYILSTALVLVGPLIAAWAICPPAGSADPGGIHFNPDANLSIERVINDAPQRFTVAPE